MVAKRADRACRLCRRWSCEVGHLASPALDVEGWCRSLMRHTLSSAGSACGSFGRAAAESQPERSEDAGDCEPQKHAGRYGHH